MNRCLLLFFGKLQQLQRTGLRVVGQPVFQRSCCFGGERVPCRNRSCKVTVFRNWREPSVQRFSISIIPDVAPPPILRAAFLTWFAPQQHFKSRTKWVKLMPDGYMLVWHSGGCPCFLLRQKIISPLKCYFDNCCALHREYIFPEDHRTRGPQDQRRRGAEELNFSQGTYFFSRERHYFFPGNVCFFSSVIPPKGLWLNWNVILVHQQYSFTMLIPSETVRKNCIAV